MKVGPEDENREHEEDPPRRRSTVRGEQPEKPDEEGYGEGLSPELEPPRCSEHAEHPDQAHAPGRSSQRPRRREPGGERDDKKANVRQERELDAAEREESVERNLREPLLVDPLDSLRPDGERVRVREAVRDDLPAADQGEPAVLDEHLRQHGEQDDGVHRGQRDDPASRSTRATSRPAAAKAAP